MEHKGLQQLIESGLIIEEKAVKRIMDFDVNEFSTVVNKINEQKPSILTEAILFNYLPQPVKVIKKNEFKEVKNIQDLTKNLNLRYSAIQRILIEKLDIKDIFSIKNLGNVYSTLIGLVKSVKDLSDKTIIEMEDPTGVVTVAIPKIMVTTKVRDDDILAISGKLIGEVFEADTINWPDTPLRSATKGNGKIIFLSDIKIEGDIAQKLESADYIFLKNCTGWEKMVGKNTAQWIVVRDSFEEQENLKYVQPPCLVDVGGILVLVCFGEDHATDVIRRRFISSGNSDFIIEQMPDIIFTNSTEPVNYKGVTIIGNGIIDAPTREIIGI